MEEEEKNKAVVGRWFKEFWGNPWNPDIVDELAAPDMLLQYSLHEPRRGRKDVKEFMIGFRNAFARFELLGRGGLDRGRRSRCRPLGRRRYAHRTCLR